MGEALVHRGHPEGAVDLVGAGELGQGDGLGHLLTDPAGAGRGGLHPHAVAGLINLRGQVVTALDLRRRLNMPDRAEGKVAMNVVVRAAEEVWSLLVDSIGGVIEVTDSTFEPPPDTLSGPIRELIRGAYKLDDALLLVLDVDKALEIEGAENAA